jgi:hypothetical protein
MKVEVKEYLTTLGKLLLSPEFRSLAISVLTSGDPTFSPGWEIHEMKMGLLLESTQGRVFIHPETRNVFWRSKPEDAALQELSLSPKYVEHGVEEETLITLMGLLLLLQASLVQATQQREREMAESYNGILRERYFPHTDYIPVALLSEEMCNVIYDLKTSRVTDEKRKREEKSRAQQLAATAMNRLQKLALAMEQALGQEKLCFVIDRFHDDGENNYMAELFTQFFMRKLLSVWDGKSIDWENLPGSHKVEIKFSAETMKYIAYALIGLGFHAHPDKSV